MAYDIYGTWSTAGAGPNAPLQDSCAPSNNQFGSCESAVKAWTAAGFPANQIMLGVPSYGHSYTVSSSVINGNAQKLAQYPSFNKNTVPLGTGETSYTSGSLIVQIVETISSDLSAFQSLLMFVVSRRAPAASSITTTWSRGDSLTPRETQVMDSSSSLTIVARLWVLVSRFLSTAYSRGLAGIHLQFHFPSLDQLRQYQYLQCVHIHSCDFRSLADAGNRGQRQLHQTARSRRLCYVVYRHGYSRRHSCWSHHVHHVRYSHL